MKPIDAEELKAAMLKFSNRTAATLPDITSIIQEIKQANKYRTRFLLTKGDALIPVQTEDIVWVGAESKRVFLMQKSGNKTTFPFSLDELQSQLNPADFFRINRSVIACRTAILKAELHFNGKIKIQLLNWTAEELFVSREKASDFKDWWGS